MRILIDKETGEEFEVRGEMRDSVKLIVEPIKKPRVIDWSKVADCVPVKNEYGSIIYPRLAANHRQAGRERDTIETGIKVTWTGGECPLPEGVIVICGLSGGRVVDGRRAESMVWTRSGGGSISDIIWFQVTGLAEGFVYE